jgi:glycolate oxidase FAD binding subunit
MSAPRLDASEDSCGGASKVAETVARALPMSSPDDVCAAVLGHDRVRVRGGGSKPALARPDDGTIVLDMRGVSGILEYEPGEYTFTARAGTTIAEVQQALARHAQVLPFDPPLVLRGATLGGTLAAGLSGSGRYRHGGVRDFVLGVRFVDGRGRLVTGGGKVVKNAAGFDLPKLMVGSLGRLGVLLEISCKVFPLPEACGTIRRPVARLDEAVALVQRLTRLPWDIAALDIVIADATTCRVDVRLAGLAGALQDRLDRLRMELGGGEVLLGDEEDRIWRVAREFEWVPPECLLVKVPVTPGRIAVVDAAIERGCAARRYVAGGQVGWLAWREPTAALDDELRARGLGGLVVQGPATSNPLVGARDGGAFAERVKQAIDPLNRFGPDLRKT